jgi:hypothetical protein
MTSLLVAAYASQVFAALAAVALAGRHPPHRPAAVALVLLAASSLLHAAVAAVLRPMPIPVEGAAVALVYVDGALALSSSAIIAGLPVALAVSPERRRRAGAIVAGAWLLVSIVLGALYPSPLVRGEGLRQVYVAVDLFALSVASLALIIEARADIAAGRRPSSASAVATAVIILDGGILIAPFSPWRGDLFGGPYFGPQLVITAMFVLIAGLEVIAWKLMSSRG